MITDRIGLHSVLLPLLIYRDSKEDFVITYDYRPNWTPLSPITITNKCFTAMERFASLQCYIDWGLHFPQIERYLLKIGFLTILTIKSHPRILNPPHVIKINSP